MLSMTGRQLYSRRGDHPMGFEALPLVDSTGSVTRDPVYLTEHSGLEELTGSKCRQWTMLVVWLELFFSSLYSTSFTSETLQYSLSLFVVTLLYSAYVYLVLSYGYSVISSHVTVSSHGSSFLHSGSFVLPLPGERPAPLTETITTSITALLDLSIHVSSFAYFDPYSTESV